ncbi:hypothetical protein [Roseimicrobium sp. ORNL1]|uniref:hypothetical protein n=1 Tax=Roseimicrobium sp. ORNL1 TaxID=2711231 RepID=UPI0013E0EDEE|nr:hypothetical protein [Roseimicrobium sp. ORNL1]QIF01469.1 hypothetical protein G5S37_08020 [Roseimicrobium sp. ORNL1]
MMRLTLSYLLRVLLVAAVVLPVAGLLNFRGLTGHWIPIREVESLSNPIPVKAWTTGGLQLDDGRLLPLPDVMALPEKSAALSEATQRGVEISQDGRVLGLVRVHHWCGNDPVREHVAKVDLADMLIFVGEATPVKPLSDWQKELRAVNPSSRFGKYGWNISQYCTFHSWRSRDGE